MSNYLSARRKKLGLTTNQKAGGSSPFRRTKITALLRLFMRSDAVIFVRYGNLTTF